MPARADPPEYAVIGQAATGPITQLWTWVAAEILFHVYLLGRYLYQQRQKQRQAIAVRTLTGGTPNPNPAAAGVSVAMNAPPPGIDNSRAAPSTPALSSASNGFLGQGVPVSALVSPSTRAAVAHTSPATTAGWGAIPGQEANTAPGATDAFKATVAPMEVEASLPASSPSFGSGQGDVRSRSGRGTSPAPVSPQSSPAIARDREVPAYHWYGRYISRPKSKLEEGFPGTCCNWVPCPCGTTCFSFFCYQDLPRPVAIIVIILFFALSIAGFVVGFAAPTVYQYNIQLARLPAQATGFRVGVLADLHIGLAVGATRLAVPVASVLAQKPHLVLLSGDLMDNDEHVYGIAWEPLRAIGIACNSSSPAAQASIQRMLTSITPGAAGQETVCLGAFAVFGNHDGDGGSPQRKVELLEGMGITVLTNDRIAVPSMLANVASAQMPPGMIQYFDLIGVSDYATSTRDTYQVTTRLKPANISSVASMAKAVENRDSSKELLVLAHQPRHAMEAASVGGGLMMSGHTHGGQLFPVTALSGTANDGLVAGLYEYQRNPTHPSNPQNLRAVVNRGTYQYGLSFRHVPSEVSLITLQAP